jgi:6-phosphogluconolactonase
MTKDTLKYFLKRVLMITVITHPKELVYAKAAEKLISVIRFYIKTTKKTLVLLSGGSSVQVYGKLVSWIKETENDLSLLAFGQVDERFRSGKKVTGNRHQALDNREINAEAIGKTGLWDVCEKKKIPYFIISQENTLEESARQYNQLLSKLLREYTYLITFLGIGEDGHTAGLIPGYARKWNVSGCAVGFINSGKFPQRITVTPKLLNESDYTIVVATGGKKEKVLRLIISEKMKGRLDDCPAVILQEMENLQIFTDLDIV